MPITSVTDGQTHEIW